ncbi:MAG TPA: GWxTD domain-containing protein [Candidatus Limnocylindrales bacterium]|nr:GWxTD domain-containing protein [Candidatus Limnocylindrales bacterium]
MRVSLKQFLTVLLLVVLSCTTLLAKGSAKDLPSRYRTWLNDEVNYIITNEERHAFLLLPTDEARDKFIDHFWELRNPVPGAPENTYKEEIYKRIAYAKQYLDGVHSAMGQTYITLGEPKQRAKYYGRSDVRNMEIWFYQNTNPALPPYFYVLFFDRDNTGTMRFYSPYMDGPSKLATSVLTVNDNKHSFDAIDRSLGREVARTTLSLLPDAPVDMQNATASLESDVMLGVLKNLANNPFTKDELEQKRIAEQVTHRILLNDEFLDVVTTPLRNTAGDTNLHYLVRLRRPSDFSVEQADNRTFLSVNFVARVFGPSNKLIFKQEKDISRYLDAVEMERVRKSVFGYEGWLALSPGKYRIEFILTNKVTKTAYKADRDVLISPPLQKGVRLSDVVAFSNAESVGEAKSFLPFTVGGVKFTPLTGDGLIFSPGQNVNVFYQIWAPPADPKSRAGKNLTVDYAYGRVGASGDAKSIHEQVAEQQFDDFGSLLSGKRIALPMEAGAGNYRLMISVSDPDSPQKVYSSLNFRVYGSSGSAPVYDVYDPDLAEEVSKGVPEFDRALCYLAQDDKDGALAWFRKALNRDPGNEIARSRLAELYFAKKDYASVAELFSRTPITQQTDEQAILQGAESMARTGSVTHAISLLENAIHLRNASGPLYLALAGYYRGEGNMERANQLESKGRELAKEQ